VGAFTVVEGDVVIRDSSGNPVGVILDGAVYRFQTEAKLAAGDAGVGRVKLTDGTTVVDVKPPSTPPVAADKALVVVASPNQQAIAVTSAPSGSAPGIMFGRVQYGGSAGALTAVRATVYTPQTVNFTGSVKSTSASDAAAGVGARTVKITYYNDTGAGPFTETVTLNGTTAVNLVNTNHCYIEKMEVLTVGSTMWNVGTITLHTGAGATGTEVGSIAFGTVQSAMGDLRTLWAHHYVPASKEASFYVLNGNTTGNQVGTIHMKVDFPLVANSPEDIVSDFVTVPKEGIFSSRALSNPIVVTGFSRVTIYVVSQGTNTHFFAAADYSEV
jgi:hypothetical protein